MDRYTRTLFGLFLVGAMVACAPTADEPSTAPTIPPTATPSGPSESPSTVPMPTGTAAPTETPHDMGDMDSAGEEAEVRIDNFAFVEGTIEVSVGTTVTWVNGDASRHTVTSGPDDTADGLFDGDLPAGETFSFTFDEAGEYPYFCDIHPTMTGTVVVTP